MTEEGFVIKDRRLFTPEGELKDDEPEAKETKAPETESKADRIRRERSRPEVPPLPELNFSTFIFSLSTSALMHLGEIADPQSGQNMKNLPAAKHTIDIIAMLQEKTKGNLSEEEANLISTLLYELRMKYVAAVQR